MYCRARAECWSGLRGLIWKPLVARCTGTHPAANTESGFDCSQDSSTYIAKAACLHVQDWVMRGSQQLSFTDAVASQSCLCSFSAMVALALHAGAVSHWQYVLEVAEDFSCASFAQEL